MASTVRHSFLFSLSFASSSSSSSSSSLCRLHRHISSVPSFHGHSLCLRTSAASSSSHPRGSSTLVSATDVPDYLPLQWNKTQDDKPLGPRFDMTAEEAISCQLGALRENDQPHPDYGIEVMYRFAGFDPFERSVYFGPSFDLGQFERFRRIFHHSTYRVLLGHTEARVLSSLFLNEHYFKQRVWVRGARPDEEETFEFTLIQRVGGCWDGYWLTESVRHDGEGISGGIAY